MARLPWVWCATSEASAGEPYVVVSYLPEWRYGGTDWDAISLRSTHVLLFSLEPDAHGRITGRDRLPGRTMLREARAATRRHGSRLMVCFGGNGRSSGFSPTVRSKKRRARFLRGVAKLVEEWDLDGVDYNWEYPGYTFGRGYMSDTEVAKDYAGLSVLLRETKEMFNARWQDKSVTMAYYPDGRQEQLIRQHGIDNHADLLHIMSYDQGGSHHSTLEFAYHCVEQGRALLPASKLTLGLPFYGRNSASGDWVTYEDLVQQHHPLAPEVDVLKAGAGTVGFNGVRTIENKTARALRQGLAGVMIWEAGQDCRLAPVERNGQTHGRTCPGEGDAASLLVAVARAASAERPGRAVFHPANPAGPGAVGAVSDGGPGSLEPGRTGEL